MSIAVLSLALRVCDLALFGLATVIAVTALEPEKTGAGVIALTVSLFLAGYALVKRRRLARRLVVAHRSRESDS